jgi:CelD/BcsL family acetyltransferase involved in cellulose biosynthesis
MKLEWSISPVSEFQKRRTDWDMLNRRCGNLPFLDSMFLVPLMKEFAPPARSVLAMGRSGEQLVAAAVVVPKGFARWETFQPSQLPLGAILVESGVPLGDVIDSLLGSLPSLSLAVGATQIDPRFVPRPEDARTRQTLDYIDTAWVEIDADFSSYWAARGKNLRQNMKKQRNRLDAEGRATCLEVIRDPASVAKAVDEYGSLESTSWKAGGGTAIETHNAQGRFYRAMLENFCGTGRGSIYRYLIGDQVAAMDLCIESDETLVILKTTYDASDRTLSPAFLMREEQFARLFAEGRIKRIEFYGKVMEWHTRWTDLQRRLYHATQYRHPLLPRLLAFRQRLRSSPETPQ